MRSDKTYGKHGESDEEERTILRSIPKTNENDEWHYAKNHIFSQRWLPFMRMYGVFVYSSIMNAIFTF